jgi:hypothetical protein
VVARTETAELQVSELGATYDRAAYTLDSFVPHVVFPFLQAGGVNSAFNLHLLRVTGAAEDTCPQDFYMTRIWMEVYQKHT